MTWGQWAKMKACEYAIYGIAFCMAGITGELLQRTTSPYGKWFALFLGGCYGFVGGTLGAIYRRRREKNATQ